jgi:hypothetical protein
MSENKDIQNGDCRSLDIHKEPFSAHDYKLVLTYVEGLRKPINPFLNLLGIPAIQKGVYVRN